MNNTYNIKIEDIENSLNKDFAIEFNDEIEGIKSDGPIQASLVATILGEFIKIQGSITGTAILECDLCLDEYNYDLDIEVDELYAKNALLDEYGAETELKEGQFVTDLGGSGEIDIYDLLYQSVILDFPNKKVCGINCKGNTFLSEDEIPQSEADPRLAVFKTINIDK